MATKKRFFVICLLAIALAVTHIFTIGYGFGYDAISIARQQYNEAKQYKPSYLAVIYERKCEQRSDFLHLEIDTTYHEIGRKAFHYEVICNRDIKVRAFDGSYIDCSEVAERCFVYADNGLEWKRLNSQRRIIDQNCNEARVKIDGEEYSVWYTTALPHCEDGAKPRKHYEGLILEASNESGTYSLKAKHIRQHLG